MGPPVRTGPLPPDRGNPRSHRKGVCGVMIAEPVLEFEELRELVGRYLRTPLGRAELEKVTPGCDRAGIEAELADTAEAIEYHRMSSQPQPASQGAAVRLRFE